MSAAGKTPQTNVITQSVHRLARGSFMIVRRGASAALVVLSAALGACAANVETVRTEFVAGHGADLVLSRSVDVQLPTRYSRVLGEGSRWRKVGTVPQGDVYAAIGTVFTIEGRNVHEAYLIVAPLQSLVGFFLPAESSVAMLATPVQLPVSEIP